jgi:sugar lactone lactonase YvrE
MKPIVECMTEPLALVGESPLFLAEHETILWVDLLSGVLFSTDATTGATSKAEFQGSALGPPRRTVHGEIVIVADRDLWSLGSPGSGVRTHLATFAIDADLRPNDGACDASGRFWVGYKRSDGSADGILVTLINPAAPVMVMSNLELPNGLAFAGDGESAFFVDSLKRTIYRIERLGDSSGPSVAPWVITPKEYGLPDGIALDDEGGLWVAMWGGGVVLRYGPDGQIAGELRIPVSLVTAVCFGTHGELYITTSRFDLDAAEQPQAGALFRAQTSFHGAPIFDFDPESLSTG